MFHVNVGSTDRVIRLVAGLLLVWFGFSRLTPPASWVVGLVGLVLVLTGLAGRCLIYKACSISTAARTTSRE